MLAAKDQIRRHGPFRRLRRALIRQPQRILSRVRRVFVSLAPAIAPSRVRFAARFKKPLKSKSPARVVVVVAPSSPPSRARPSACVASASRPRRRQSSRRHRVARVRSRRARSFASASIVRTRVARDRALERVLSRARERSTRDRSRAHLVERARRRAGVARGRVCRELSIRVRDSCGCGFRAQTVRTVLYSVIGGILVPQSSYKDGAYTYLP